jgi:signal transduction histidine kinase
VRSLIASTFSAGGEMFGSLSVGGVAHGAWDGHIIHDFRLLNAAIASRLTLEHSRRALAEAIDAGTEAQLAYQHFFGAVGHELRTPLAAVLGYTEVLLDDAQHTTADVVSAGVLRDGPVILRACEQLLAVGDNLLGAGRTLSSDDQRQAVVVADAVSDVVHWHRTPASTAGVEMVVDVDPAATVWAHASGVRQVLTNLLGNAIAHHRPAGGTVHLSVQRLRGESAKEMVRIIVRDDGPGLTPDQVRHAFEPFVRFADPGTKGSGLGLSISRTIAERDGGAVRGESTPGDGSSFWLELPAFQPALA